DPIGRLLEPAARPVARQNRSALALAQQEVRVTALRARARDRPRVQREVARGIVHATVERAEPAAPLDDRAPVLRTADSRILHGLWRLVLARRIVRAGHVGAIAAVPAHERVAATRARLPRRLVRPRLRLPPLQDHVDDVAAPRVRRAPQERLAGAALPQLHGSSPLYARGRRDLGRV